MWGRPPTKKQKSELSQETSEVLLVAKAKWPATGRLSPATESTQLPSSASPDLAPLRRDAPGRKASGSSKLPEWRDADHRAEALSRFRSERQATTTADSHSSILNTIGKALVPWGLTAFPMTLETIECLGASLKEGAYQSSENYFSAYRTEAVRRGQAVDQSMDRALVDAKRSCKRGMGGKIKARPLPFLHLERLALDRKAWIEGGPVNPSVMVAVGAWWLCREVELATVRARMVELSKGPAGLVARLHLPASKTDPEAHGAARSHVCRCSSSVSWRACPVHLVIDQLRLSQARFPDRWSGGQADWDLVLFPTSSGAVVSKAKMNQTVVEAARRLGVPERAPDGTERVSGHSLRCTGAQGLASLGWHLWKIQLMGRWGSDVVKEYLREAPLEPGCGVDQVGGSPAFMDVESFVEVVKAAVIKDSTFSSSAGSSSRTSLCGDLVARYGDEPETLIEAAMEQAREELRAKTGDQEVVAEQLVVNLRGMKWHRAKTSTKTVCGWGYAEPGARSSIAPSLEDGPRTCNEICEKCFATSFPELRLANADELVPWWR